MAHQHNQSPIILAPKGVYPNANTPISDIVRQARALGVYLDAAEGLVLYNPNEISRLKSKITKDLFAIQNRIIKARGAGKHAVLIPGAFDLTHAGHLFYIEQIVACCLKKTGHARKNFFVTVLIDSDMLIRETKKYKLREEPLPRPVESADERARSLAAFNAVDMIGVVPSPLDSEIFFPEPRALDTDALRKKIASASFNDRDRRELEEGMRAYDAFQRLYAEHQLFSGRDWKIQAWQLYILGFISASDKKSVSSDPFAAGGITRWISTSDMEYKDQVAFVAEAVGICPVFIEDIEIGFTSALLARYITKYGAGAWDVIRAYKADARKSMFR